MGEISTGDLMGLSLMGGLFSGGFQTANTAIRAGAEERMTTTNAGAWQAIAIDNNDTREAVAKDTNYQQTEQTKWNAFAAIFMANAQYLSDKDKWTFMGMESQRAHFTQRKGMIEETRGKVLAYNAALHVVDSQARNERVAMKYNFELQKEAMRRPVQQEIVVNPNEWLI